MIAYSEYMTTRGDVRAALREAFPRRAADPAGVSTPTRHHVRIGVKFGLVLVALVPSLIAVGWVGVAAQQRAKSSAEDLYDHHVLEAQDTAVVDQEVGAVGRLALQMMSQRDPRQLVEQRTQLVDVLIPQANTDLAAMSARAESPEDQALTATVTDGWEAMTDVLRLPAFERTSRVPTSPRTNDRLAEKIGRAVSTVKESITELREAQTEEARSSIVALDDDSTDTLRNIILIVAIAMLVGAGSVVLLIRDVVPRLRSYSRFAANIATGHLDERLDPRGADELSELGHTLNAMADRRAAERRYDRGQADLNEALQVTQDEDEAHQLLKRHLERSIPGTVTTILNRNNSANRLQATTPPPEGCDLSERLRSAQPRACLAVRLARPHDITPGEERLLSCQVCGGHQQSSRCEPLLVGGEVIGSVLVQQQDRSSSQLTEHDERRIRESVTLAAPVLANQRNLAMAEYRALNDALTGLPNQRACHDTLLRMAAQASRTVSPLAAVLLDLDHFKQLNDEYGHDRGDEALAAVGAALGSCMRASDFAGRYGGEEFLLLMPDTGRDGAVQVAEKARSVIAQITLPGVDRPITASLGVAILPDDAVDPDTLIRQADRALYAAKAQGRNRVLVVEGNDANPIQALATTGDD
jgi:diguanylate cyclase (GGDEF)-like protein